MNWIEQLCHIYDKNADSMELSPISHMYLNAQVEVDLGQDGTFLDARIVKKEDSSTLIPVTEASAGRTGSAAFPHALSDTLPYLAGDFSSYCRNEKLQEKHTVYLKALGRWAECGHEAVKTIYTYLSKKTLVSDLIRKGILQNDKFEKRKINGQAYEKVLVRFRTFEGGKLTGTWENRTLIQSYIDYYRSSNEMDICYATGEYCSIGQKHPKGILPGDFNAKLVSSNDSYGFTYRGLFRTPMEACALGYETSQKMHSALRWLMKGGIQVGNRVYLCFTSDGEVIPDFGIMKVLENDPTFTASVTVMGLESATPGRISIVYYSVLPASEFQKRIHEWRESWCFDEEIFSIHTIIKCAYGNERNGRLEVDDRCAKEQGHRLLKCMIDAQPFPYDMVRTLANKASHPESYSRKIREWVLSATCFAICKRKGEMIMHLDTENKDRDYLFGRLLAVLEKVERRTMAPNEGREPNVIRYWSAFTQRPMTTWQVLENQLAPYFARLRPEDREKYRSVIEEIVQKLDTTSNAPLNEEYLLGYYLQRKEL